MDTDLLDELKEEVRVLELLLKNQDKGDAHWQRSLRESLRKVHAKIHEVMDS